VRSRGSEALGNDVGSDGLHAPRSASRRSIPPQVGRGANPRQQAVLPGRIASVAAILRVVRDVVSYSRPAHGWMMQKFYLTISPGLVKMALRFCFKLRGPVSSPRLSVFVRDEPAIRAAIDWGRMKVLVTPSDQIPAHITFLTRCWPSSRPDSRQRPVQYEDITRASDDSGHCLDAPAGRARMCCFGAHRIGHDHESQRGDRGQRRSGSRYGRLPCRTRAAAMSCQQCSRTHALKPVRPAGE